MSRFHKIVVFLIAIISFSQEDAFAVWPKDRDGFRPVCARKASHRHHSRREKNVHSRCGRKAVSVPMRPGMIFGGPVPLYAKRACGPVLMRLNGAPAHFCRPEVRFGGFSAPSFFARPAVKFGGFSAPSFFARSAVKFAGFSAPASFFPGRVWSSSAFKRPGGFFIRTK